MWQAQQPLSDSIMSDFLYHLHSTSAAQCVPPPHGVDDLTPATHTHTKGIANRDLLTNEISCNHDRPYFKFLKINGSIFMCRNLLARKKKKKKRQQHFYMVSNQSAETISGTSITAQSSFCSLISMPVSPLPQLNIITAWTRIARGCKALSTNDSVLHRNYKLQMCSRAPSIHNCISS